MVSESRILLFDAATNIRHFAMKNIPAFKPEDYLTSPENYISKIEFQLSKESNDGQSCTRMYMNDWERPLKIY